MKFTNVDNTLSFEDVKNATERLQLLLMELGVRKDNEHIGSGRGGNERQLLVLLSLNHELVSGFTTILPQEGKVLWGCAFLRDARLDDIRSELDNKFESLSETNNVEALLEKASQYASSLDGQAVKFDPAMSPLEMLAAANYLCEKLANDLDGGVKTSLSKATAALGSFPLEVLLPAIRTRIGIERIVKYSLDDYASFGALLRSINNLVCENQFRLV